MGFPWLEDDFRCISRGCGKVEPRDFESAIFLEFLKHMFWEEDSSIKQDKPIVVFLYQHLIFYGLYGSLVLKVA